MGLFEFYEQAGDYKSPDPSTIERPSESGARHAAYYKRIVLVGCVFGVVGVLLGVVTAVLFAEEAKPGKGVTKVLLTPFLFGAAGILFGVAVACLFAPREFLTSPVGEKWMNLIGTKDVLLARIVCLIFVLVVMAPFVGMGLLVAFGK